MNPYNRLIPGLLFLFWGFASFHTTQAEDSLPTPTVSAEPRCGAGIVIIKAESTLEGTEGLMYNWYEGDSLTQFIESIEAGIFITPQLINSKTYAVSISLNGKESKKAKVVATIQNTANILEYPKISLCDSVTLHASTTFNEDELDSATYQWQHYEAKIDSDAMFRNLEDSLSRVGLSYVTRKPGFYRIVVTLKNGCRAISKEVEVTEQNILEPYIQGAGQVCFYRADHKIDLEYPDGRSFAKYLWEESINGTDFDTVGTSSSISLINPTTAAEDSAIRYYRLTLIEQNCSTTSLIDTVKWYRNPQGIISRLGSQADFFYCETDAEPQRTMVSAHEPHCTISWYRSQHFPISYLKSIKATNPFDHVFDGVEGINVIRNSFKPVFKGDSILLTQKDWGLYVGVVTDTITGCSEYTNMLLAETAIPDFDGQGICQGDTVTFSPKDSTSQTYQWSYAATEGDAYTVISSDTSIALYPPETTGDGRYQLTVTKNGCTASYDTLIEESTMPPEPFLSPQEASVCPEGGSILLSSSIPDSANYTISWKKGQLIDGELNKEHLGSAPDYLATAPGTYYFSVFRRFCGYTKSIKVKDDSPNATLNVSDSVLCGPISIALKYPDEDYSYQWYFSEDSSSFVALADEQAPEHLAIKKGYYYALVSDADECQASSKVVQVSAVPSAPISTFADTALICGNEGFVPLETDFDPDFSYLWMYKADTSSDYVAATGENNSHTYEANAAGHYKVQVAEGSCSTESDSIYAQHSTASNPNFTADITGMQNICLGNIIRNRGKYFTHSAQYRWSYSTDSTSYTDLSGETDNQLSVDSNIFSDFFTKDSLTLYLQLEVSDSLCASVSEPFPVIIKKNPDILIRNSKTKTRDDVFYCGEEDQSLTLSAYQSTTNMPLNYQWQQLGPDDEFVTIASENSKEFSPQFPGTYRCLASAKGTDCSLPSNTISVKTLPGEIFIDRPVVCDGETFEILADPGYQTLDAISEYDFSWYFSTDGQAFDEVINENTAYFSIHQNQGLYGEGYVYFKATNGGCTKISDTVHIAQEEFTELLLEITDASCFGVHDGSLRITPGADDYQYSLDGSALQSSSSFTNLAGGNHTLTAVSPLGCQKDTLFEIENGLAPVLTIQTDTSQTKGIAFEVTAVGTDSIHWFPENYFQSPDSGESLVTIPESYPEDTVVLLAEGFSGEGCISYQEVIIHLKELDQPWLSNFFTPNDDGLNDFLEIKGIKPGDQTTLSVFDNWGTEIFTVKNYENESSHSVALNSALKKEGVYFYLFRTSSTLVKGSFYIKR